MGDRMTPAPALPAWQKILSDFLVQRGIIDAGRLAAVQAFHAGIDHRIGQLSLLKGYISLKQVFDVLGAQAQDNLRFGEAAVRTGAMTDPQVQEVLSLQKNPPDLFLQSLVFAEIVPPARLPVLMDDLRRYLGDKNRPAPAPAAPTGDGDRLAKEEVRNVLKRIKSIGALSAVIQKVLHMVEDPNCDLRELGKAVTADPNLTAQLLRVVNSAALGGTRKISAASEAIGRIGVKGLRNVALATAVLDRFQGSDKAEMRRIWMHSVRTSQWAQTLAVVRKDRFPAEDAFIAGLIHDLGETILRQFFPEAAQSVDRAVKDGRSMTDAEQEVFGQTHEDAGAFLCDLWSFPLPMIHAVAFHHAPVPTLKAVPGLQPVAACVNAACRIADLPLDPEDPAGNRLQFDSLDPEFRAYHRIDGSLADHVAAIDARSREMNAWLG